MATRVGYLVGLNPVNKCMPVSRVFQFLFFPSFQLFPFYLQPCFLCTLQGVPKRKDRQFATHISIYVRSHVFPCLVLECHAQKFLPSWMSFPGNPCALHYMEANKLLGWIQVLSGFNKRESLLLSWEASGNIVRLFSTKLSSCNPLKAFCHSGMETNHFLLIPILCWGNALWIRNVLLLEMLSLWIDMNTMRCAVPADLICRRACCLREEKLHNGSSMSRHWAVFANLLFCWVNSIKKCHPASLFWCFWHQESRPTLMLASAHSVAKLDNTEISVSPKEEICKVNIWKS